MKIDFNRYKKCNNPKKAIIAIHGWGGNKDSFLPFIVNLNIDNVEWFLPEAPYLIKDASPVESSDRVVNDDYQFIPMINSQTWYLPDYNRKFFDNNRIKFSHKEQNKMRKILFSNPNSIIIIGGLLQEYLSSMNFNNEEGALFRGKTDTFFEHIFYPNMTIEEGIIQSINDLLKHDHKIILIYPIPEVGWNVSN